MKTTMRTIMCGEPRMVNIGEEHTVCGWVQRRRDLGQLLFIDLRDRSGILQLALDENTEKDVFEAAGNCRSEFVLLVRGIIRERSSKNPELPTGDIELEVMELRILSESEIPPFEITSAEEVNDALRLKHRYLDLRRSSLQQNLMLRHNLARSARDYYHERGFIEIETPMLTKSTPEGARDYLVPSRLHPGEFYALPQSPQQYKQLLMLSGFDRYMQITRCFRDEDLRADRQPEFTQLDMEMSFIDMEDVLEVNEGFLARAFKDVLGIDIPLPLPRLTWHEAMERFGSDKPDLRFGFELQNISDIVRDGGFKLFTDAIDGGGSVRMIKIDGGSGYFSRKKIDALTDYIKTYRAGGLAWIRLSDGAITSSIGKHVDEVTINALINRAGAVDGDLIFIVADAKNEVVFASLGALRCECARQMDLIDKNRYELLWVVEFPLFEYSEEDDRYVAMHHPFTSPLDEDVDKLETDKASCRAKAYDAVLNGVELGSGSIRINEPERQKRMFEVLGFDADQIESRFGHIVNAFKYGAPPHGGFAFGLDRLAMLMAGESSIREVIAFPKVQNASELMTSAPSPVDEKQLEELGIQLSVHE